MARRGPRIGRVDPLTVTAGRLIPTPDDWHPAIFVNECFELDPTHETAVDQDLHAWQGPGPRGAFERPGRDQYAQGAYVRGSVIRWLLPDAKGKFMLRVCFWGDDDTGRERDFWLSTEEESLDAYLRWIGWMNKLAYVSMADLGTLGFVGA